MATIKKNTNNKCWWEGGEKEPFIHCWREGKLVQPLWKTVKKFLKKLKIELSYDLAISLMVYKYLKKTKTWFKKYIHPNVHSNIIYNCQDMEVT